MNEFDTYKIYILEQNNIPFASIFNCCSNRSKTAGNFIFKFKK